MDNIVKIMLTYLVFASSSAYAYIDPATGSLIIQGLIAAVVGALAMIKFQYGRIKSYCKKIFGKNNIKDELNEVDESHDKFEEG